MGMFVWIALVAVGVYAVILYNGLVNIKEAVAKAWANIDVLLKQRHDELPKLVDTCKEYMKHEQVTLEKVMLARSRVSSARESHNVAALGSAEAAMKTGLGGLFAVAESYPELKSNEQFLNLQARISGLENAIADRREFYNDSVNINNVGIAQFPSVLLARLFNFKAHELLKFTPDELKDVDIGQRFGA